MYTRRRQHTRTQAIHRAGGGEVAVVRRCVSGAVCRAAAAAGGGGGGVWLLREEIVSWISLPDASNNVIEECACADFCFFCLVGVYILIVINIYCFFFFFLFVVGFGFCYSYLFFCLLCFVIFSFFLGAEQDTVLRQTSSFHPLYLYKSRINMPIQRTKK